MDFVSRHEQKMFDEQYLCLAGGRDYFEVTVDEEGNLKGLRPADDMWGGFDHYQIIERSSGEIVVTTNDRELFFGQRKNLLKIIKARSLVCAGG